MDDICYIDGCPGAGNFYCSCDDRLRICQDHIAEHIRGTQYHEIRASRTEQKMSQKKANDAIVSLSNLNTKTLLKGKEMFRELCDQLCGIIDNLSQRQQSLVELSSLTYTDDVEEKIKELEKVNIAFRNKKDFRKLLTKFMSPEQDSFDSSSFEEFRKDFKVIVESLQKSNEVLEKVADSHKSDQELRENLEKRVVKLEKNNKKIKNFEEKLEILNIEARKTSVVIENVKKELEKNCKDSRNVQRMFKDKMTEAQQKAKQQFEQIQALENNMRKGVEETAKSLNEKNNGLIQKLKGIEEIKDFGFRNFLEKFFNEVNLRRIMEQEEMRKKQIAEEAERKRVQEEAERKRVQEEAARVNPEKRKVDAMNLSERILYFAPLMGANGGFNKGDVNYCNQLIKQLLVTNDGKYLFNCIIRAEGCIDYEGTLQAASMKLIEDCESYSVAIYDLTIKKYVGSWQHQTSQAMKWKADYPECQFNF